MTLRRAIIVVVALWIVTFIAIFLLWTLGGSADVVVHPA